MSYFCVCLFLSILFFAENDCQQFNEFQRSLIIDYHNKLREKMDKSLKNIKWLNSTELNSKQLKTTSLNHYVYTNSLTNIHISFQMCIISALNHFQTNNLTQLTSNKINYINCNYINNSLFIQIKCNYISNNYGYQSRKLLSTQSPSMDPTMEPTLYPSILPTISTNIPTHIPTLLSLYNTTIFYNNTNIQTTNNIEINNNEWYKNWLNFEQYTILNFIVIGGILLCVIFCLLICCIHCCCSNSRRNSNSLKFGKKNKIRTSINFDTDLINALDSVGKSPIANIQPVRTSGVFNDDFEDFGVDNDEYHDSNEMTTLTPGNNNNKYETPGNDVNDGLLPAMKTMLDTNDKNNNNNKTNKNENKNETKKDKNEKLKDIKITVSQHILVTPGGPDDSPPPAPLPPSEVSRSGLSATDYDL